MCSYKWGFRSVEVQLNYGLLIITAVTLLVTSQKLAMNLQVFKVKEGKDSSGLKAYAPS